ncbi:MAG: hypothetical protein KDB27_15745 [Planctomycetales bacterium]|nr:hypothetical protein [Planctomycetales bacterium]
MLEIDEHPLLDCHAFISTFPQPLGEIGSQPELVELMSLEFQAPVESNDDVRKAVRDLLRLGGFKPTGRSKPASEYLIKAAANETLGSINLAVDVCNVVSLHSGLPISVVDLDRVVAPLRVCVAPAGTNYVFNQSGQTIDVSGLLCLFDKDGPCANGVKDSQRSKTSDKTVRTLTIIWGTNKLPGRTATTADWYHTMLENHNVTIETIS